MYLFFVLKSWVFQGIPRHTLVSASGAKQTRQRRSLASAARTFVCVPEYFQKGTLCTLFGGSCVCAATNVAVTTGNRCRSYFCCYHEE